MANKSVRKRVSYRVMRRVHKLSIKYVYGMAAGEEYDFIFYASRKSDLNHELLGKLVIGYLRSRGEIDHEAQASYRHAFAKTDLLEMCNYGESLMYAEILESYKELRTRSCRALITRAFDGHYVVFSRSTFYFTGHNIPQQRVKAYSHQTISI
jgi:hypothetical protein